jgi:hypothetical protein
MAGCDRRLFGLSGGLCCTGSGEGHTHTYESAWLADAHDEGEAMES